MPVLKRSFSYLQFFALREHTNNDFVKLCWCDNTKPCSSLTINFTTLSMERYVLLRRYWVILFLQKQLYFAGPSPTKKLVPSEKKEVNFNKS